VAVSGGNMYQSSVSLATFALVSGGSSAFDETNPALMADTAFQKLFVADGIPPTTNTWTLRTPR